MYQSTTFGTRLAQERKRLGLSQSDFAVLCDVSPASQFVYEKDARSPSADYLAKAVRAGVRLGFLFESAAALDLLPLLTLDQIVNAYIETDTTCRDSMGRLFDLELRISNFKERLVGVAHENTVRSKQNAS